MLPARSAKAEPKFAPSSDRIDSLTGSAPGHCSTTGRSPSSKAGRKAITPEKTWSRSRTRMTTRTTRAALKPPRTAERQAASVMKRSASHTMFMPPSSRPSS
jgi:hypothetical protein